MKHTLLHRFASIALSLGTFLSVASLAHANTVTLPQPLSYDGLTFVNPLTYDGPFGNTTQYVYFGAHPKLEISKDTHQKSLEAIVITPTITTETAKLESASLLPTPTIYLRPTLAQIASVKPTTPVVTAILATPVPPTVSTNVGGLNPDTLFGMVNSYRQAQGLASFQKDDKTCSLAASRAPEVAGEIAAGTMHSGLQSRNLPYWNTENIISMNSEQAAFNWWINDGIHHAAIVGNYTTSCVACSGNACAEEFTSYQSK